MNAQLQIEPQDPRKPLPSVTIYTDGGCHPNPGFGGWAAILRCGKAYKEICGSEPDTTNNRMEMRAVIEALDALREPCRVTVYSDSKLIVVPLLNGTGKPAHKRKNQDLVQEILRAMRPHQVSAEWVRGHNGNPDNERCDQLAAEMIRRGNPNFTP